MKKTFEQGIVAIPCYMKEATAYNFITKHIIDSDYNCFELYYDKNSNEVLIIDVFYESEIQILSVEKV